MGSWLLGWEVGGSGWGLEAEGSLDAVVERVQIGETRRNYVNVVCSCPEGGQQIEYVFKL